MELDHLLELSAASQNGDACPPDRGVSLVPLEFVRIVPTFPQNNDTSSYLILRQIITHLRSEYNYNKISNLSLVKMRTPKCGDFVSGKFLASSASSFAVAYINL